MDEQTSHPSTTPSAADDDESQTTQATSVSTGKTRHAARKDSSATTIEAESDRDAWARTAESGGDAVAGADSDLVVGPVDYEPDGVDAAADETAQSRRRLDRKTVLRFILAPIFLVVAIVLGGLAALNATVWKPDPRVVASTIASTRYVVSDPGVLSLSDKKVVITVRTNQQACLAVGSAVDTAGWLSANEYTRVRGLSSWDQLSTSIQRAPAVSTSPTTGSQAQGQSLALADSDMWLTTKCGTGTISLDWQVSESTQSLIIDTNPTAGPSDTSGHRVSLSLSWVRTQVTNFVTPLIFIAVLCLLMAVLCATLFAVLPRRKKALSAQSDDYEPSSAVVREAGDNEQPRWDKENEPPLGHTSHRASTPHRAKSSRHSLLSGLSRRKGKRGADDLDEGRSAGSGPAIVDVAGVNMVARQQAANAASADSADEDEDGDLNLSTTVISRNEIAEYLARLSSEHLGEESADGLADSATPESAAPEKTLDVAAASAAVSKGERADDDATGQAMSTERMNES